MITIIIFSRNRPAQLDLLLRSIHANQISITPIVLYRAVGEEFEKGYVTCHGLYPQVTFIEERDQWFKEQVEMLIAPTRRVMFLCDDDVFYGRTEISPWILELPDVLCFSTRLGENTTYCYPLDQPQTFPKGEKVGPFHIWEWEGAEHDFGYPGSIDGTVFRSSQILEMIRTQVYYNPNTLEEAIQKQVPRFFLPKMACSTQSTVVGLPINIVNTTHPNRHENGPSTEEINERFLQGERLSLSTVQWHEVNGAHTPFELKWEMK